jgi:hypothetical protein
VRAADSLAPAESSPEPERRAPPTPTAVAPHLLVPLPPSLRPKSHLCDHEDLSAVSLAKSGDELAGIPPDYRRPRPQGPNCIVPVLSRVLSAKQGPTRKNLKLSKDPDAKVNLK